MGFQPNSTLISSHSTHSLIKSIKEKQFNKLFFSFSLVKGKKKRPAIEWGMKLMGLFFAAEGRAPPITHNKQKKRKLIEFNWLLAGFAAWAAINKSIKFN